MIIRTATIHDIEPMHRVRTAVTENALPDPSLITAGDYETYITEKGSGWVCIAGGQLVGFAIVDITDHNVWALFVMPGFDKKGIGRQLHDTMLDWYFTQTKNTIWLGTAPGTRAETFYRKSGWTETGMHGKGEIKFEMSFTDWSGYKNT